MTGIVCWWPFAIVDIPNGWHLCDGTNGTPDYRNVLLIGAGDLYTPGQILGSLTHRHYTSGDTFSVNAVHTHEFSGETNQIDLGDFAVTLGLGDYELYYSHQHDFAGETNEGGALHHHYLDLLSEPSPHLPPCKAGCWIMKL